MTTTSNTKSNTPAYIAYHVRDGKPGEKAYFNRIGVAFQNTDGKGFNILLDVIPLDGKITLRVHEEQQ